MPATLNIFWNDHLVGRLTRKSGAMVFQYDQDYLENGRPISLALPLQEAPFRPKRSRSFFAGLLPEEQVRNEVARWLGIKKTDDFSMLAALGEDVAGALVISEKDAPPDPTDDVRWLDESALSRLFGKAAFVPLALRFGARLSLAGAQHKAPVVVGDDGRLGIPVGGQPSTHILKPENRLYPGLVDNEHFCMTLARLVGFDVPQTRKVMLGDRPALLVERYDRIISPDGSVSRIHQEDFAQALGVPPEKKYACDGGPSIQSMASVVCQMDESMAMSELVDRLLFNLSIGNNDAHAKNFSILHAQYGICFAPQYDLVCTALYQELDDRFAMPMGGARFLSQLSMSKWERFARNVDMSADEVRDRALMLFDMIEQTAIGMGAESEIEDTIRMLVLERIRVLESSFTGKVRHHGNTGFEPTYLE